MRRPSFVLQLCASLSLALAPFSGLHAHVGNDGMLAAVHGGHGHSVAGHAKAHADAHAESMSGHAEVSTDAEEGDELPASAHLSAPLSLHDTLANAAVVHLSPPVFDQGSEKPVKVAIRADAPPTGPPRRLVSVVSFESLDDVPAIDRAHLRPLLRGPPR